MEVGVKIGERWRTGLVLGWCCTHLGVGMETIWIIRTGLGSPCSLRTSPLTLTLPPAVQAERKDKVLSGGPCERMSHPYQAALYNSGHLLCGGVLIHPSWVLTAAHCKKP